MDGLAGGTLDTSTQGISLKNVPNASVTEGVTTRQYFGDAFVTVPVLKTYAALLNHNLVFICSILMYS